MYSKYKSSSSSSSSSSSLFWFCWKEVSDAVVYTHSPFILFAFSAKDKVNRIDKL